MREWLRDLRNQKELTMKAVAEKLGISESYYCAIENGERQKRMDMLLAAGLSAVFEIPVVRIIELDSSWKAGKERG